MRARLFLFILLVPTVGCVSGFDERAKNGITFYCPGAGNMDLGGAGISEGLSEAGYKGQVASVMWTVGFNAAIDQTLRINADLGAKALANKIREYNRRYPGRSINVIGLSAGSGVAVWALEDLKGAVQVDNVVLLSSSLNHEYDVGKALKSVRGNIYNYYSPNDAILAGPMKIFGTIDGVRLTDGAGAVGLHSPTGGDRIINIKWRPEYQKFGHSGGHFGSTSPQFVRAYISKHIMSSPGEPPATEVAMHGAEAPPDEPQALLATDEAGPAD